MRVNELKDHIRDIVERYFAGATVMWAEHKYVKPSLPFITLKLGSIQYTQHNISIMGTDALTDYIPSQTRLEVQLFTEGEKNYDEDGDLYIENTAVCDMIDFVKYMNSRYVLELCDEFDITFTTEGPVKDISALLNDTQYEFRAMQEFFVSFTQTSEGRAGISRPDWTQTPSGGGTEDLANMEDGYIVYEDVVIEEENQEEV